MRQIGEESGNGDIWHRMEEFDKRIDELGWSPEDLGTMLAMQVKKAGYEMKKSIRDAFRWVLELLFQAASLILDTIRTFFLIVLSILGPSCFCTLCAMKAFRGH